MAKKQKQMSSEQMVEYINQSIVSGYPPEEIRQNLIQSGWDASEVDDTLRALGQTVQGSKRSEKKRNEDE